MDLTISKYRIYLHQFSNIVLGTSVIALLLSLRAASMEWDKWAEQIFVFLVAFGAIFHGWWRNAELFTTAKAKTPGVYVVGVLRIVLLLLSLLWLRSVSAMPNPSFFHYQILFGMVAITLWVGMSQQVVFLRPLYGKARVMQKREYLTDLFYALSMTFYVAGLIFLPEVIFGLIGYGVVAILIAVVRPIAKASTPWTEPAPPHRGGRGRRERPQQAGSRSGGSHSRSRIPERDPRDRRPRKPVQNRDRSRARSERPMVKNSRSQPEYRQKPDVSHRAESRRETTFESPRAIREPNVERDVGVEKQKRATEPPESKGQKYGRRRRGRKRVAEQKDASTAGDKVLGNGSPKESPDSVLSEKPEKKDESKVRYGRKRVKTRAETGQLKENESGASDAGKTSGQSSGEQK